MLPSKKMDRTKLPYRKNCEGYLVLNGSEVIARDTGKGYIEFPGGGVDENEMPESTLLREAYEEAGVVISGHLKQINVLRFIWGTDWAKTEKQKIRYQKYKGEEMYFFTGHVKELVKPRGDSNESGWTGKRTMFITEAINKIKSFMPFPKKMKEYYEFQITALEKLRSG